MLELSGPLNPWLDVRSLERAKEFYGTKLGLPLWHEEPAEALHFGAGGAVLSLHVAADGDLPPRGSRLVFTVAADVDGVCEELRGRGISFEKPLADRPFGRSAMFRDPDGHELWVCRPSETETQFHRWRLERRTRERRVPVQRRIKVRRHERTPHSRRTAHPQE
jgi:catechol 2,3-dioxygenase-like lactoylglutathione lyase family enzyme